MPKPRTIFINITDNFLDMKDISNFVDFSHEAQELFKMV